MWDWFRDPSALTPHGFCLLWEPGLLWLFAGSDAAIMLAYYSIPAAIIWFMRRRPDVPFGAIGTLFAAFILACGTTHGMSILTLWVPAYHVEAMVKLVTAGLSILTAIALWRIMPQVLAMPSAAAIAALNNELQRANDDLELRVAARTAELTLLNKTISRNAARLRTVVEAAPNAMVMTSANGTIEMVNSQTERVFGYERAEMIGLPVEMLLPLDVRARHPELRRNFFTSPRTRPMGAGQVLCARRKDGTNFEVEIGLNPIETDDGPMVLAAVVDVSERIRMEARLRHAEKMEAVGRVTAGVAHDFNNLLQSLGGSLELLLDQMEGNTTATEWLEVALRAAARGGELTGRLLAFSRQQILHARAVPVAPMLSDLHALIRHLFEGNASPRIELVVVPCPDIVTARADPAQLEAALINLAVNARDAMMDCGGCLRISAYEADADPSIVPPGRYTVISVADTGVGMSAETLAKACEPFFTTKGLNGSGLGLSMVQGFARQSGGEAHVVSAVGQGTTVDLWLPSAGGAHAIMAPAVPGREDARGHVLLVDDSPDVLVVAAAFLRHARLDVTTMSGGNLAVDAMLAGQHFDVIVADFAMPGMNGLELLARAKRIDPSVEGVIITGFGEPLVTELEHVAILRKPFNRAELIEKVREHIELRQRA